MTATIPQPPPLRTFGAHPKKVVAIGDSLIYGYGDSEGGGWVERLRVRWLDPEQPGPILYNLGVRGDRVAQVANRLEREFCDRGELRNRTPDVLILSVGLNDSARVSRPDGRLVTDVETFKRSLDQLLAMASLLCPVFFIGMVPVNEAAMPHTKILYFNRADQIRYRDITHKLCGAYQIPYLDLLAQCSGQSDEWVAERLCADGLHPNALGYRTILKSVQSWMPLMQAMN